MVLGFSGSTGETGLLGLGLVWVTLTVLENVDVSVEYVQNVDVTSEWLEVITEVTGQ
jgi:hypothetical protein